MAVNILEVLPEVERIAKRTASDFPDVDWRDVSQHLSVLLLSNQALEWKGGGGSVKRILNLSARSFCLRERACQNQTSVQYSYRPSDVGRILETAFSDYEVSDTFVPDDAVSIKASADALDLASDVHHSWTQLNDEDRKIIFSRYALGIIPDNASYERKKLNKAVNRLTRILNNYTPTNRRKAISNSAAQYLISKGY